MVLLQLGLYIASSTLTNISRNKSESAQRVICDDQVFEKIEFKYDEFIETKVKEAVARNKELVGYEFKFLNENILIFI